MLFLLTALLPAVLFAGTAGDALIKDAQASLSSGNYPIAIRKAREAAALYRSQDDFHGLAHAMTRIGLAELYSGDYAPAVASFDEALEIARKRRDRQIEAESWNGKGAVFYDQGRYSASMDSYRESLRVASSAGKEPWAASSRKIALANIAVIHETLGQYQQALELYLQLLAFPEKMAPQQEAQLLSNIGTLRRRLGDPQKALATYRGAQALYRGTGRLDGEIAVLINIGIVQALDLLNLKAAAATFSEAMTLADRSGNRPLGVQTRLHRGEAYFRAARFKEAEGDFELAARDAIALGKTDEAWRARFGLARIAFTNGQTANGWKLLQQALSGIESLRASLSDIGLRPEFLADKRDVYDLGIEHSKDPEEVFRLLELSRGRLLRDRAGTSLSNLRSIAGALPKDTAILEYWMTVDGSGGIFWITREESKWQRLSLGPEALLALRELPSLLADAKTTAWRRTAQTLARVLLPATEHWKRSGIEHLVIVADRELQGIPFEVLPMSESQLLIQRFRISYLSSASSYQAGGSGLSFTGPWHTGVTAIANPEPNTKAQGMTWPRLAEARREVLGIARYLHGTEGVHMDRDAQRHYLSEAAQSGVLHLATHAVADTWNPSKSFILFAASEANQKYDAMYLNELLGLHLTGVSLATLSACETGAGKQVNGEGVQSFSVAFLAAGARSVVASLWRVSDDATADLMLGFYRNLASGKGKAEALRQAKLEFLSGARRAHPAYWAAFILTGESDSRLPYRVGWLKIILLLVVPGSVALAIRTRVRAV